MRLNENVCLPLILLAAIKGDMEGDGKKGEDGKKGDDNAGVYCSMLILTACS